MYITRIVPDMTLSKMTLTLRQVNAVAHFMGLGHIGN